MDAMESSAYYSAMDAMESPAFLPREQRAENDANISDAWNRTFIAQRRAEYHRGYNASVGPQSCGSLHGEVPWQSARSSFRASRTAEEQAQFGRLYIEPPWQSARSSLRASRTPEEQTQLGGLHVESPWQSPSPSFRASRTPEEQTQFGSLRGELPWQSARSSLRASRAPEEQAQLGGFHIGPPWQSANASFRASRTPEEQAPFGSLHIEPPWQSASASFGASRTPEEQAQFGGLNSEPAWQSASPSASENRIPEEQAQLVADIRAAQLRAAQVQALRGGNLDATIREAQRSAANRRASGSHEFDMTSSSEPPSSLATTGYLDFHGSDQHIWKKLIGNWIDFDGNHVRVYSTDAWQLRLVASMSTPSRAERQLPIRLTRTGRCMCGNCTLDVDNSSTEELRWIAPQGRNRIWVRARE